MSCSSEADTNAPAGQSSSHAKTFLLRAAADLGLDVVRVTSPPEPDVLTARLGEFLAGGRHGDMHWMAAGADRRADCRSLLANLRSVIMIGHSYAPGTDPLDALLEPKRGAISVYAKGRDYHDVLKAKIKILAERFAAASSAEVRVFVDTAPLMEKPLAARAGIGWQGKHTNVVSRQHGSWLFLGAILTDAVIEPDAPETDHCGSCQRCLDVCPTQAFPAPYQLDARRCLAYLSIEHKGHIPREFRAPMKNRIFGCDDCLAVCPWNKFAEAAREARYKSRIETNNPPLADLLELDDAAFRQRFAGTPIKRTGRDRFTRNVLIAAGNSGDAGLHSRVESLLGDPSAIVRGAAVWALQRLGDTASVLDAARSYGARETDASVQEEWKAGLQS